MQVTGFKQNIKQQKTVQKSVNTPNVSDLQNPASLKISQPIISQNNLMANYAVNFKGAVENAARIAKYPKDHQYRSMLAKEVGCKPETLMCVVGPDELKDVLKTMTPKNFYSEGSQKINPDFRISLHMHTENSDGTATVEHMLDKAVEYANKMKLPPFYIALTDHDTMYQGQQALKLIAKNPDKYKNIRYIPGIEINIKYQNDGPFKIPKQIECLGYCVNPFDKEMNAALDKRRLDNQKLLAEATKRAGKEFNIDIKFEDNNHPYLKLIINTGLKKHLNKYGIKDPQIDEFFAKNPDLFPGEFLTAVTPTIEEVQKTFKTGLMGLAHPGRISLKDLDLKPGMTKLDALTGLFKDIKSKGLLAAEANYQYHLNGAFVNKDPDFDKRIMHIYKLCKELGLYETGGIDAHGSTIFERKLQLKCIDKVLKDLSVYKK